MKSTENLQVAWESAREAEHQAALARAEQARDEVEEMDAAALYDALTKAGLLNGVLERLIEHRIRELSLTPPPTEDPDE